MPDIAKGYQLEELIRTYGEGNYLRGLRARFAKGEYTPDEYSIRAARAYLFAKKPRRAIALLERIDPTVRIGNEGPSAVDLLHNAFAQLSKPGLPTCSLNMIVRDEAAMIEGALDSVDTLVDEIIIVDTGSVDDTVERARPYGCRIVKREWSDDFAAARNAAIEASSCRWILWIDADDRMVPGCKEELKRLWQHASPQVAAVCIDNEQKGGRGPEFLQFRLFPRDPDIRFERRVHEQVVFSAERKVPVTSYPNIRILHIGYMSSKQCKKKAARNLPLIRTAVQERPSDYSLLMSLGECYSQLGKNQEALAVFTGIADDPTMWEKDRGVFVQAHFASGWMCKTMNQVRQAKKYLYRCIFLDRKFIEAYMELGMLWYAEKKLDRAFYCFVKAADTDPDLRLISAVDRRFVKMKSLFYLAEILLAWDKPEPARELLERAVKFFPQVVEFYAQMGNALMALDRLPDAARWFRRSLELSPRRNPAAYVGVARIYLLLNSPSSAADFLLKALDTESSSPEVYAMIGELHSLVGNTQDASEAYQSARESGWIAPPSRGRTRGRGMTARKPVTVESGGNSSG